MELEADYIRLASALISSNCQADLHQPGLRLFERTIYTPAPVFPMDSHLPGGTSVLL